MKTWQNDEKKIWTFKGQVCLACENNLTLSLHVPIFFLPRSSNQKVALSLFTPPSPSSTAPLFPPRSAPKALSHTIRYLTNSREFNSKWSVPQIKASSSNVRTPLDPGISDFPLSHYQPQNDILHSNTTTKKQKALNWLDKSKLKSQGSWHVRVLRSAICARAKNGKTKEIRVRVSMPDALTRYDSSGVASQYN